MSAIQGLRHSKLPHDAIVHTRQPVPPVTSDEEQGSRSYEERGLMMLREQLENIARAAENNANLVDEYNSAAISGAGSSTAVIVQPTYEYMPEKIEAIIITGPTGAVTLTLGDRIWQLTIPASGIINIGAIGLVLSRTDVRQLTSAVAGTFTLELMGIADARFRI